MTLLIALLVSFAFVGTVFLAATALMLAQEQAVEAGKAIILASLWTGMAWGIACMAAVIVALVLGAA